MQALAKEHLVRTGGPYVVKADGLAAGKGVLVTESLKDATAWVDECLDGRFGSPDASVVIEGYMDGDEVSVFFLCADGLAIPLEPARDYKRLSDGDQGPNTGGMGSYSPINDLPDDLIEWTTEQVALPTLAELERRRDSLHGLPLCRPDVDERRATGRRIQCAPRRPRDASVDATPFV